MVTVSSSHLKVRKRGVKFELEQYPRKYLLHPCVELAIEDVRNVVTLRDFHRLPYSLKYKSHEKQIPGEVFRSARQAR